MKIGIDLSPVVYGTGVSVYLKNLAETLLKIDQKNDYVFFFSSLRRSLSESGITLKGENFSVKNFKMPPLLLETLWNQLHLFPVEKFIGEIDVFHASDWAQPPAQKTKIVATIHDLSFLRWPQTAHPQVLAAQKRRLAWVKKEAAKIIAVSEATKKEIIELLGIEEKRIEVVYEALPDDLVQIKPKVSLKKFGITKSFVMASGSQSERKNISRTIKAFALLKNKLNLQLAITGEYKPEDKLDSDIIVTGFISRPEWAGLLKAAKALVYPSVYEGFGLPILEAFYLGVPVVTSNLSSMKEIAGRAALLVDPYSSESIAKGIEKIVSSREANKNLKRLGKKRLKDFSWEKAARKTLKIYEQVAKT
ncbi:MAG: glycosyltransferase family 1 protein [Candidatus Shapirobacteria bacterium]